MRTRWRVSRSLGRSLCNDGPRALILPNWDQFDAELPSNWLAHPGRDHSSSPRVPLPSCQFQLALTLDASDTLSAGLVLVRWNLDEAEDLAHALLMSSALLHEIIDEMNDCTALSLGEKNDKRMYDS